MLTTHITNTHTYTHALPLWLQQSVRYEPIKLVCISLKREAEGEHALYYRRNVGTKSLCKFALRRSTDPPPSRRLHGTSVFTLSVSALIYSILLGLVCVCLCSCEDSTHNTVDDKSISVLAEFLCERWAESVLLICDCHMRRDIFRYPMVCRQKGLSTCRTLCVCFYICDRNTMSSLLYN